MKQLFKIFFFCITLCLLCGCTSSPKTPLTKTGFYFDTTISITLYDTKNSSLLDTCFAYCEEFEQLFSRTFVDSDISRINFSAGKPVEVSETTVDLLRKGIEYGDLTNGIFDITIAPLSELWDFKNNPGNIPSDTDITEALSHVNYKNIIINGNTVILKDPKASIDLGGIAKGYIADRLKEYLISEGVQSALINLGGNVLTIGEKPDGTPFHIGVQRPFDKKNTAITSVSAVNSSVVTSGSYERYFKVNAQIYHHVLNTATGYPCDNNLLSVTILSEDSITGDALSTSCFLLGLEGGKKLIQSMENVDAIFITTEYEIIDTRK